MSSDEHPGRVEERARGRFKRADVGLHSHIAERLIEIPTDRSAKILDPGCGTGAFLARLIGMVYTSLYVIEQWQMQYRSVILFPHTINSSK